MVADGFVSREDARMYICGHAKLSAGPLARVNETN